MKLFDLDGPFQRYGSMAFDIIAVNTMWLLITIFSFGILNGPATTAAYGSLYASIISGEGYMFKQFFKVFRKRFFSALIFGIFSLILILISLFNIYMIFTETFGNIWLLPVYMFIFIEVGFISTFTYPLLAHTQGKLMEVIKTAFFLANKHLPTAVLASLINAGLLYLVLNVALGAVNMFIYVFFVGGIVFSLNSYLISKRVLKQYDFFEGTL